ncbi:GNAT family N-acetyltransferase [Micromonospora purpureochromogenes]|uniref:GNAT family N-acetyltransferase n=1 Tax=Micromonospora purpureochromogenes TaxID=47872 RepID=UPI0033D7201B
MPGHRRASRRGGRHGTRQWRRWVLLQVVDICVLPEHQGRGLGKRVMAELTAELESRAPAGATSHSSPTTTAAIPTRSSGSPRPPPHRWACTGSSDSRAGDAAPMTASTHSGRRP